jgi:ribosome-binding factor A
MAGDKEETHATLSRSAGFLRSQLAKAITVFKIPALQFTYDDSVEHGMALDHLIDKAVTLHAADDETEE